MREARAGDRYLLCSDGLSDPVSDETIHEALQIPDVAESAYRLIELALRGGGPDNVTVVVADVVDYDYGQTQPILAGAVSGEDDQLTTLPNTSAGRASAINPRKETAKRLPPQVETVSRPRWSRSPDGYRHHSGGAAGAGRRGRRALGHQEQLLHRRVQRHRALMRGIQGSLLGISLNEPYLVGCLNPRNELSLINYGQSGEPLNCHVMKLQDLPLRTGTGSGCDSGRLAGQAEAQLRKLRPMPYCPARHRAPHPRRPTRAGHRSQTPRHCQRPARPPLLLSPTASPRARQAPRRLRPQQSPPRRR